ncbi:hypothetical protein ENUP19_0051G0045 [Entamoeba nuttalli]|uniref:Epsin-2 n=1 Tax=Entamoeba nuttalli TaxID=412467 RepID=A0ABQ0DBV3_9EUKA
MRICEMLFIMSKPDTQLLKEFLIGCIQLKQKVGATKEVVNQIALKSSYTNTILKTKHSEVNVISQMVQQTKEETLTLMNATETTMNKWSSVITEIQSPSRQNNFPSFEQEEKRLLNTQTKVEDMKRIVNALNASSNDSGLQNLIEQIKATNERIQRLETATTSSLVPIKIKSELPKFDIRPRNDIDEIKESFTTFKTEMDKMADIEETWRKMKSQTDEMKKLQEQIIKEKQENEKYLKQLKEEAEIKKKTQKIQSIPSEQKEVIENKQKTSKVDSIQEPKPLLHTETVPIINSNPFNQIQNPTLIQKEKISSNAVQNNTPAKPFQEKAVQQNNPLTQQKTVVWGNSVQPQVSSQQQQQPISQPLEVKQTTAQQQKDEWKVQFQQNTQQPNTQPQPQKDIWGNPVQPQNKTSQTGQNTQTQPQKDIWGNPVQSQNTQQPNTQQPQPLKDIWGNPIQSQSKTSQTGQNTQQPQKDIWGNPIQPQSGQQQNPVQSQNTQQPNTQQPQPQKDVWGNPVQSQNTQQQNTQTQPQKDIWGNPVQSQNTQTQPQKDVWGNPIQSQSGQQPNTQTQPQKDIWGNPVQSQNTQQPQKDIWGNPVQPQQQNGTQNPFGQQQTSFNQFPQQQTSFNQFPQQQNQFSQFAKLANGSTNTQMSFSRIDPAARAAGIQQTNPLDAFKNAGLFK